MGTRHDPGGSTEDNTVGKDYKVPAMVKDFNVPTVVEDYEAPSVGADYEAPAVMEANE